jgi:hypothetical protein
MGVAFDSGIEVAATEWRHTSSLKKHKFRQTISTRKIMCTVLWDRQGVLLVEFLPQGTTINSTAYCETMKKLRREACLFVDLCCFMTMLGHTLLLKVKPSSHHLAGNNSINPPYIPDLVPRDFHLFLCLKKFLAGQHFLNDDDIKEAVKKWLSSQAATFYKEGIQKLVPCYDKCLNNCGNYVEK